MQSIKYNKHFFYKSTQAETRIACLQYPAKGRCQWLLTMKRMQPIDQKRFTARSGDIHEQSTWPNRG